MYLVIEIQMAQMEFFGIQVIESFEKLSAAEEYLEDHKKDFKDDHPWSGDLQTHLVKRKGNQLYWLDKEAEENTREFKDGWNNYFKYNPKTDMWDIMDENDNKRF